MRGAAVDRVRRYFHWRLSVQNYSALVCDGVCVATCTGRRLAQSVGDATMMPKAEAENRTAKRRRPAAHVEWVSELL